MPTASPKTRRRPPKLVRRFIRLRNRLTLQLRWILKPRGLAHGRAVPLIVSLTSYPARYSTLHLTLQSLLLQSVRPDHIILWIAHDEAASLPEKVTSLTSHGLDIRFCENWKSFKKIIPTLMAFPNADIVTADDDIYYWPDWLKELLVAAKRHPGDVIAHRMHEITISEGGIRPYRQWNYVTDNPLASAYNFATSGAGAYYPAGCFHTDVLDKTKFMQLCPTATDIWLHWMACLNGHFTRHSGTRHTLMVWKGTQETSLWGINKSANDEQIQAMVKVYGPPQ